MEAKELYSKLEEDFIGPELSDDWEKHMTEVQEFLSENFKQRSMGLVCDNSKLINKVYTAVFPTEEVMKKILSDGVEDALLFVHHPSIWDLSKEGMPWYQMNKELLKKFKEKRISIYNLHVPLDNYGEYSTSKNLADILWIKSEKPFAPYFGALCGIIGKSQCKTTTELQNEFENAVGHEVSLYQYGTKTIKEGKVAVIAGGGNDVEHLQQVVDEGVNTFITGIAVKNDHSQKAHDFAKEHKINILGGTHYSTEKFACIEMCKYFKDLGLESEFVEGKPGMEDL
ncbi:MAG: Nif3-like dinuclear metal center hexameric protein [Nanobdellota archaeon]